MAQTLDNAPADPVSEHGKSGVWRRGLFMLVLMFLFGFGQSVLFLTAVVQFLWLVFANAPNAFLMRFGKSLSLWLGETARFLTCATDDKPFPWMAWPRAD